MACDRLRGFGGKAQLQWLWGVLSSSLSHDDSLSDCETHSGLTILLSKNIEEPPPRSPPPTLLASLATACDRLRRLRSLVAFKKRTQVTSARKKKKEGTGGGPWRVAGGKLLACFFLDKCFFNWIWWDLGAFLHLTDIFGNFLAEFFSIFLGIKQ